MTIENKVKEFENTINEFIFFIQKNIVLMNTMTGQKNDIKSIIDFLDAQKEIFIESKKRRGIRNDYRK